MKVLYLSAILIVSFLARVGWCGPEDKQKLQAPDAKSTEAARKLVKEIYQEDFKSARTNEQKCALAKTLFETALTTNDDPTGRFVLLQIAGELAAENADFDLSMHAVNQLEEIYEIDSLALTFDTMKSLIKSVRGRDEQREIVATLNVTISKALTAYRYDLAKELAKLAQIASRTTRDVALVRQSTSLISELDEIEKEQPTILNASEKLKHTPTDAEANLIVGRFSCFIQGDWESGIPMLALCSNQRLKKVAEKEMIVPTNAEETTDLADAWWDLSEKESGLTKRNLMIRAKYWYKQALPQLSGLTELRVRKRLQEGSHVASLAVTLPAGTVTAFDFESEVVKQIQGKEVLSDLSDSGADAELSNSNLVRGKHGSAISFGAGGYARFPDEALPKGDTPRTVLFWLRLEPQPENQVPFAYGGNEAGDATYLIVFPPGDAQGRGNRLSVGTPGGRGEPASPTPVSDGKWHHAGLVYDGNGTVQVVLDGQLDLTFLRRFRTTSPGFAFIGNFVVGPPSFRGAIDDFLVLNRAAPVEEIRRIMKRGFTDAAFDE